MAALSPGTLDGDSLLLTVIERQVSTGIGGVVEDHDASNRRIVLYSDTRDHSFRNFNYAPDSTDRLVSHAAQQAPGERVLLGLARAGTETTGYKNGDVVGSVTSAATFAGTTRLRLGRQSIGNLYFGGLIAEVVLYDADKAADRADIEAVINDHYNIFP